MKFFVTIVFGCLFLIIGNAQNRQPFFDKGFPFIQTFTAQDYDGFVNNYAFTQDTNGFIYSANQGSVLEFDGFNFKTILAGKNRVTVVYASKKGTIYIGSVNEFGYLSEPSDSTSILKEYISLKDLLLPDESGIGSIGEIVETSQGIFFRSRSHIIWLSESKIVKIFRSKSWFEFAAVVEEKLFVKEKDMPLSYLNNQELHYLDQTDVYSQYSVRSILPGKSDSIIIGFSSGDFIQVNNHSFKKLSVESSHYLSEKRFYRGIRLRNGKFVFGTFQGGIVIADEFGKTETVIDKNTGLLSDAVYALFEDAEGNLWVGHDNGFSVVKFSVPIRILDERLGINEIPAKGIEFENELWLITQNGVLTVNAVSANFIKKEKFSGNCKNLFKMSKYLLTNCGNKLWFFKDGLVHSINYDVEDIIPLWENSTEVLIKRRDGYEISKIDFFDKKIVPVKPNFDLKGIITTSFTKGNEVWVSTISEGIYRLEKKGAIFEAQHFPIHQKIKEDNKSVRLGNIDDKVLALTSARIFRFDELENDFIRDESYTSNLTNDYLSVFEIMKTKADDIWLRANRNYFLFSDQGGNLITKSEIIKMLNEFVDQHNQTLSLSKDEMLILSDRKLISVKTEENYEQKDFKTSIREVFIRNDSLMNGGAPRDYVLSYNDNELRFTYSGASFIDSKSNEYQYKLDGYDEFWSTWSTETQKDYTNLKEGKYIFKVRSRNIAGANGVEDSISFTILSPWYRTWWAYSLYTLIVGFLIYAGYKIRLKQILRVQKVRNRIADDLHDDVTGTLVGISNFANAAQITQDEEARTRFINLIKETADDTKEKITDIVWAINPEHDDWQSFLAKCRRYASDIFESSGIEYEIDIVESISGKITMDLRQNFWLIYKEIITNIVKHAQAPSVFISINVSGNGLALIVKDDGKGFNTRLQNSGNGILSIHKRAKQVEAEAELDTEMNKGTTWTIRFLV